METKVAIIGIIVEKRDSAAQLNTVLSEYADSIIGRMGIPYEKKGVNCVTIVIDASTDEINALCGKLGRIDGISSKAAFSNV